MKTHAYRRSTPRLVALLLLAASAAVGTASADERGQHERGGGEGRHADHRALAEAVRRVERATGGEVLSAERVQSDGRDVSRVKVVDASGRVRVYLGDAQPRERQRERTRGEDSDTD